MTTAKESSGSSSKSSGGLRNIVAAQSKMSSVNGEKGILIYQGYDVHDLAENSTFEETVFLLWNGRMPQRDELDALKSEFRANYGIPAEIITSMKSFPKDSQPMDVLRTAVSTLDFYDVEIHKTDV